MKWILIFSFLTGAESQPVHIEFDDREACMSAGRLIEDRALERLKRKTLWICVPKGKIV